MPLQATSGAASYDAFGGGVAAVPNYIEDVFSTYLYTGNGFYPSGGGQTIVNGIDLAGDGGLIWIKARSTDTRNGLYDTARGINKMLGSDSTAQEYTDNAMVSANSNGFTLGAESSGWTRINLNGEKYASWTFRKQPKFFDVVTYTGDNTARTIAHDLGSVPGCIIIKRTDSAASWWVYHTSLGATKQLVLNSTSAQETTINWNNTSPTSTVFSLGGGAGLQDSNINGATYVAYLFANDAGGFGLSGTDNVISCGSIELDGSSYSTVNLGYEPQWVLTKNATSTSSGGWEICDNMRGMPATSGENYLLANSSAAEGTGGYNLVRPTSTGFSANSSAGTYIYIAIRRGPMKVPTSGTSVFAPAFQNSTKPGYTSNFPVDFAMRLYRGGGANMRNGSRLTGANHLESNTTAAEASDTEMTWDYMNGWGNDTGAGTVVVSEMFRRAPSFFDEVCYTGTGSATTVTHNLGVAPELMIVKARSATASWRVYSAPTTANKFMVLNAEDRAATDSSMWNGTAPTASVFSLGNALPTNWSGQTFVAYLFASAPGVSKVGSYTGTGATLQINCGFTTGARFVLIKRTDDPGGDWYVWDSARGIVAGNDPYLLLNSTAAEVTSTDYVDTYSAGFEISSTAPAAINASGGTYIFLAIA